MHKDSFQFVYWDRYWLTRPAWCYPHVTSLGHVTPEDRCLSQIRDTFIKTFLGSCTPLPRWQAPRHIRDTFIILMAGPNKLILECYAWRKSLHLPWFKEHFPLNISVELRKRDWENTWNLTVNKSWNLEMYSIRVPGGLKWPFPQFYHQANYWFYDNTYIQELQMHWKCSQY